MNDLRERIAEKIMAASNREKSFTPNHLAFTMSMFYGDADTILALIPKPTVRVKCDKCGGSGRSNERSNFITGAIKPLCPFCTDGWNEHEIVWERRCHIIKEGLADTCMECSPIPHDNCANPDNEFYTSILELPDLIDPDVAETYVWFKRAIPIRKMENLRLQGTIPNNKGSLKIGEVVK